MDTLPMSSIVVPGRTEGRSTMDGQRGPDCPGPGLVTPHNFAAIFPSKTNVNGIT